MRRIGIPLFFLILASLVILPVHAQNLSVTVTTDRSSCYLGADQMFSNINISGKVKQSGNSVSTALVSVLVDDTNGNPILLRTVNTGSTPQFTPLVDARNPTLSDSSGTPLSSVKANSQAYFTSYVYNDNVVSESVLVVYTIFDADNQVIGIASDTLSIPGRDYAVPTTGINIPSGAVNGVATVYVDALTAWPSQGGAPFCNEVSNTFSITNGRTSIGFKPGQASSGSYIVSFKLPIGSKIGSYSAYAGAYYSGSSTSSGSIQFTATLMGDLTGDNKVDYTDIVAYVNAYMAYNKTPPVYTSTADLNFDGKIDYFDTILFAQGYVAYYNYGV